MVYAPDVLAALKTSAEVKDTIKYPQKGVVTEQLLAELFGVKMFLVPERWSTLRPRGGSGDVLADSLQESPALLRLGEAQHPCTPALATSSPGRTTSGPRGSDLG
jgi:hypothetical protein